MSKFWDVSLDESGGLRFWLQYEQYYVTVRFCGTSIIGFSGVFDGKIYFLRCFALKCVIYFHMKIVTMLKKANENDNQHVQHIMSTWILHANLRLRPFQKSR